MWTKARRDISIVELLRAVLPRAGSNVSEGVLELLSPSSLGCYSVLRLRNGRGSSHFRFGTGRVELLRLLLPMS